MKYWVYIVVILMAHLGTAQSTLYSENFDDAAIDGKGTTNLGTDLTNVSNWTVNTVNGSFTASDDYFKVVSQAFSMKDADGPTEASACWWFSSLINISNYTDVTIYADLIPNASSSSNFVRLYYSIDGGGFIPIGAAVDGNDPSVTRTISGLSGSTLQIRVGYWGTSSLGSISHDNVLVTGISTCAPTTQAVMGAVSNLNSQYLDLAWTAGDGDRTLIVASPAALIANPSSGTGYNADAFYGNGDVIGNGYVVFDGPSGTTNTTVTGLLRNTSYVFTAFTYNSSGNCYLEPGDAITQVTANLPIAYYVDDNSNTNDVYTPSSVAGNDSNNGKKNTPFASLSQAFSSVIAGDTIYVDAGTYTGSLNKDLNTPVEGLKIYGAGNELTLFDNQGAMDHYFLHIDENNTTLSDMRLTDFNNESVSWGQCLGVQSNTTGVEILYVIVQNSSTSSGLTGYPIEVRPGAEVLFRGGAASCNNWDAGGGIQITGAATIVTIEDYLFFGNYSLFTKGCALRVNDGTVNVWRSKFDSNEADQAGVGAYLAAGTLNMYDCEMDNQQSWFATDRVGGTILVDGGSFSIRRSIISNHGQLGGSSSYGAGIGVTGGNVTVEETSFSSNDGDLSRATDLFNDGGTVTVTNCTFASSDPKIGSAAGTLTLSQSGSPSFIFNSGLSFVDADAPSFTPNPNVPIYTGDCASQITNLPVELISFEGMCQSTGTELKWQTVSEYNNAFFIVERAGVDGQFELIAKTPGSLNSSDLLTYYFTDEHPKMGLNYYRLSQVDVDGRSESFEPITVYNNCAGDDLIVTYVARDNALYFSSPMEGVTSISVLNMAGQLVEYLVMDPHETVSKLQLKNPPGAGVYLLKIDKGGMIETGKVLITK